MILLRLHPSLRLGMWSLGRPFRLFVRRLKVLFSVNSGTWKAELEEGNKRGCNGNRACFARIALRRVRYN
jgi:hypothetical protein